MKAGVRGVLFAFAEFELQLADHEPVVQVNISTPEDPGVLDILDITPPNDGIVNLVLGGGGGVSSFRVNPLLI